MRCLAYWRSRLAKRLCPQCKQAHSASVDEIKSLLQEYCAEMLVLPAWKNNAKQLMESLYQAWLTQFGNALGQFTLYRPVGCEACSNTGYKGRLGLHELLVGSDQIKQNIQSHARVAEMLATALTEGMRTLKQDGIERVLQGIADMQQVRAVCVK